MAYLKCQLKNDVNFCGVYSVMELWFGMMKG